MTGATNRPNISANQSFSVALTFDLSTLNAQQTPRCFPPNLELVPTPAFSWSPVQGRGSSFRLLGYQPNQREIRDNRSHRLRNRKYRQSVCCNGQKPHDNNVNLDVYLDSSKIGSITSNGGGINFSKQLEHLFVGGKGTTDSGSITNSFTTSSDLTLEGMQIVTGGVMDENAFKSYYNQLVPEPATASLSLLGLSVLMLRRRRS